MASCRRPTRVLSRQSWLISGRSRKLSARDAGHSANPVREFSMTDFAKGPGPAKRNEIKTSVGFGLRGKFMAFKKLVAAIAGVLLLAPLANAQDTAGVVNYLKTEPGSVMVQRDGEVFLLSEGDAVLPGDLVFTRTNGSVRFNIYGCSISLGGQSSIQVSPNVCSTRPTVHPPTFSIAGVELGTGGGGIGATGTVLSALLVAGGVAAGSSGGDNDPASP